MDELSVRERRHVWHPFTQMQDWEAEEPLFIESASGVRLRDRDGREYFDANSSLWVNVHGHRCPEIDRAIAEQLGRVAHSTLIGLTHPLAAELAERLVEVAPPGLNRVFYSDGGAEAVEIALKMAYQYWRLRGEERRTRFIAHADGYHGDTIGSVSVGGIPLFHAMFRKLVFDADFVPSPSSFPNADTAAAVLETLLREREGQVAAVVIEPLIQAAGGMLVSPPGYLARVRELCNRYGTLLIADEVATGFGRTGRMFACEHEGVTPDLMCMGKGLTAGYLPMAATLTTDAVYREFLGDYAEMKTFFHGHSYAGNPLACAAALAGLDVFRDQNVLTALAPRIESVRRQLARFVGLPHVGDVRQIGLMVGIELVRDRATREPYGYAEAMGQRVCRRARTLGLITRPLKNVIVFMPPLCSSEADLAEMLSILYQAIRLETEAVLQ